MELSMDSFHPPIQANLLDVLHSLDNISEKCIDLSPPPTPPQKPKDTSPPAVDVNNVCKTYGDVGATQILSNFSMKVPSGAIYSLLGSSGCGKTTVLSCIIGQKEWDSGTVKVLGHQQQHCGRKYLEIARRIGYMPQELALYEHLTVKEIIQYYGKLYGLSDEDVDVRWRVLAKLLELSSKRSKQIKNISGGQKRRVSLAIALVHKPQLLVLDEPTVGLDPLLRRKIWKHLHELVFTLKTTVLITTHYVEETKHSNMIGIMRNGRMLIEDTPSSLLSTYKSDLLQDAILQICLKDHLVTASRSEDSNSTITSSSTVSTNGNGVVFQYRGRTSPRSSIDLPDFKCDQVKFCGFKEKDPDEVISVDCNSYFSDNGKKSLLDIESSCHQYVARYKRMKDSVQNSIQRTLSFSSVLWIYLARQPIFAFILLFLPAVQLLMTFYVVGKEPTDLKLGVINNEVMSFTSHAVDDYCQNVTFTKGHPVHCDLTFLSCHIQNDLLRNEKINLVKRDINNVVYFTKKEIADGLMHEGSLFGYITFSQNYSVNLANRFMWGRFAADDDSLEKSKLIITLDKSHYLAYHLILKEIMKALRTMSENLELTCGALFDHHNHEIALHYREPVFGNLEGTHQDSIIPAIVAQILFEILYGIAPMILIHDLKQGTFTRSNLAGLRFPEFMLGIFVTMGPILLVQSISCYVILQYGFAIQVKGSFLLFILLCMLAGLCGQGFGIYVGILVKSEFSVIVSAIMVVPIIMTCSGTLWPLASHPNYLMFIYYIFPSAPIVSSLRSVVLRGVGAMHSLVWPGLVNTITWSVVFSLLSIHGFRKIMMA